MITAPPVASTSPGKHGRALRALTILLLFTLTLGCGNGASTGAAGASEPTDGEPSQAASAFAGTAVTAAGLNFELPDAWTAETPSSSMRAAQASIPGSGGAGQMTMFFFGPGGGRRRGGQSRPLDRTGRSR